MKDSVKNIFQNIASEIGFKKKGDYYYKHHQDLQQVVGLRKSKWGNYYSIWLGISINAISDLDHPPIHKCQVQCCVEDLVEDKNEIVAALNEEDRWKMDAESRREALKLALSSAQFYFFNATDSLNKLRDYLQSKSMTTLAINRNARDFLKLK